MALSDSVIRNNIFHEFLSGNFENSDMLSVELSSRRLLPRDCINNHLTYNGAENLCYGVSLPKKLLQTLELIHREGASYADFITLDQLRRCMLLDSSNCLTQHGYYKMIASLPLRAQVNELALSYGEQPVTGDTFKTEEYVRASYENIGYRCVHDEGGLLYALMDSVLRPDSALLKSLISQDTWYTPDNPFYEAMVSYLGNFETIAPNGPKFVSSHRKLALLEIMQKASEARVIAGHDLHSKAFANLPPTAGHKFNVDLLVDLFTCIGTKRLCALLSFHLDHPDCGHGLPDLIAFKENELIMIEVKRNDKLMFHQARTLHTLAALPREVISDIGIVKVISKGVQRLSLPS